MGPFDRGPHRGMPILRNGNVACPCHLFSSMSHVKSEKVMSHVTIIFSPCRKSVTLRCMLNLRNGHVAVSILGVKGHNSGGQVWRGVVHTL